MRIEEAFRFALANLASHKLRSALTMLGMMFGVGAVIAMLSIGAGAEQQALEIIDRLGVRNVVVRAKDGKPEEQRELRKKSIGVSLRDAEAIIEAVPGVERVSPRLSIEPYKVLSAHGKTKAKVYGVSYQEPELVTRSVGEGRFFDAEDESRHAQVCVLGFGARRDLFGFEPALGREVKVDDVWCEVVGVLSPETSGATSVRGVAVGGSTQEIYLPVTTALRRFEPDALESPLEELIVRLDGGISPAHAAAAIETLLARLHGGAADYELIVPEALLEQSRRTQRLFDLVMGCIAGISLLVGGIGIMNVMFAAVLELTREIGVRRAVGARKADVRVQFLATSFSISVLGGALGIALGIGIAEIVAAYAGWPTVVTPKSILLSTGVSVAVGITAGLFPAIRAANLNPIEALRYE
jgi:putative ABC transport system permease protein